MTLRRFIIALGIVGVLLWLTRRRDRDIEYPEQPEPPKEWWRRYDTTATYIPEPWVTVTNT